MTQFWLGETDRLVSDKESLLSPMETKTEQLHVYSQVGECFETSSKGRPEEMNPTKMVGA